MTLNKQKEREMTRPKPTPRLVPKPLVLSSPAERVREGRREAETLTVGRPLDLPTERTVGMEAL